MNNKSIAQTPKPPYYAVIFTTLRTDVDAGYKQTAERMFELASNQDGFLGVESARDGLGITVSYWKDLDSIHAWRQNMEHVAAKKKGKEEWYTSFRTRIALVEKEY